MKYLLIVLFLATSYTLAGQNLQLAENYADQGEYDKAYAIYSKAYQKNKRNINFLKRMVEMQQQLENYTIVDSLLDAGEKFVRAKTIFPLLRGYNLTLQGQDTLAAAYYNETLESVDSLPNTGMMIAKEFEKRSLLPQAIESYERAMAANEKYNYSFQVARLYGEQGKLDKMFASYVDLIEKNEGYLPRAQATFSIYITDDAANTSNKELRKVLLTRVRQQPRAIYNELLSWLFVQQKDYNAAFVQEKALYNRDKESIQRLQNLAVDAYRNKDYDAASNILNYVVEETQVAQIKYVAQVLILQIRTDQATVDEYAQIDADYQSLLDLYGRDARSFSLQQAYARFLAFKADQPDRAIDLLTDLKNQPQGKFQKANVKMLLADILVLKEQFNRALILYSQIPNDLPNSDLAQESQFKVARTSYYQGDFKWSLTQLKVLRNAASKLIANDAMQLSLTISDHSMHDTTYVALSAFAKAELKQYQNKNEQALSMYSSLLQDHKGDPIEDEALLRQAQLFELQGENELARKNYEKLIEFYGDGILADDALYELALLFESKLIMPEKAQELYEKIIYNHADSIFFIDARRRYRKLRGDFETNET
ncbi:tetratricopeptide repeat protein [Nonlabens ponticola]|uniref:Tetratricopeptide repeat protein n=1 Tax=Nonlabens ponticola TaxID=2496866 RepID=A0A3S9MWD9_9FLAO|nr:tetratricopeptide repeat protein [Nonlabens ponticola]AZQ43500.1 tetratricopeptide repeat protein [Nonlabens ponticola]